MCDLTVAFNGLLKEREAPPTRKTYSLDKVDEFLKEAYQISSKINLLHSQLRDVRQAYLSTAAPRKSHLRPKGNSQHASAAPTPLYLTDRDREEIDANAKAGIRTLNAQIRGLAEAEEVRQRTEAAVLAKKYSRGLGALGKWAAGTGALRGRSKSPEHQAAEEASRQLSAHRESVLWYLRQKLQELGALQQYMMETRLTREMEKNRSVLAKARGGPMSVGMGALAAGAQTGDAGRSIPNGPAHNVAVEEQERRRSSATGELTDEQVQMFEKDNQAMLKYYQGTLDKVRTAEQSLIEIAELQTLLVNNLETQSAHVDQLVADSLTAAENVGGGNKQLKKATQRPSMARYTFYAATGLCLFLIGWDAFI